MAKPGLQKRFSIPQKLPVQYRGLDIRKEWIDEKKRTVEFSFSSITPVERWYGFEILSHDPGAIDFRRFLSGAALLENHNWDKQIGVIEKAWVENSEKGYVRARFSKHEPRAEIVWGDVLDEIRKNVSVGYLPLEWTELIEEDAEEENEIPTLLVLRWEPHEVSVVSVPADYSVGFGREQDDRGELYEVRLVTGKTQKRQQRQIKNMATRHQASDPPAAPPSAPTEPPGNGEPNGGDGGQHVAGGIEVRTEDRRRANQMLSIGYRFNCVPEAERALEANQPIGEFLNWVLTEKVGGPVTIQTGPAPVLGLSNREIQSYSIVKAIRELSNIEAGPKLTGLELEASEAMAKRLKRQPEKGFFLPPEVTRGTPEMRARIAERAIGVGLPAGTTGGQLVPTDFQLPMIDYLRNWLVVKQAGARLLTGLSGNLVIPKQNTESAPGAQWLTETGEVGESDITFTQVPMQPRRLSTFIVYNRQLVIQSAPDIENLVREDMGKSQAQRLDHTALFGTGVAPIPRGILNQVGINRFTFGSDPLYPAYVSAIVALDDSKVSISSGAWIANPTCWGAGISTPRFEYTGITVIVEPSAPAGGAMGGTLLGYPYLKTQQIPTTGTNHGLVFFGNWSDLMIGSWDGTELIVDPYTLMRNAQVRVVILDWADVAVRYPEAFAVSTDNGYGGGSPLRRRGQAPSGEEEKTNGPAVGLGTQKTK